MLVHAEGAVDSNDGAMDGAGDEERNISEGFPAWVAGVNTLRQGRAAWEVREDMRSRWLLEVSLPFAEMRISARRRKLD